MAFYHPISEGYIMREDEFRSGCRINKVDVTGGTLTGRGGMALYVRYLSKVGIYPILMDFFGRIRKSKKGLPVRHKMLTKIIDITK